MGETQVKKVRAATEGLSAATAEVARLRKELTEAETRRDGFLKELLEHGAPLKDIVLPPRPNVVVQSRYQAFLQRLGALKGREFGRRDALKATGERPRTLGQYLWIAVRKGILRRVALGRYVFASPDERK